MPYPIFDKERRQVVVAGIRTDEQANAKLAELVEADVVASRRPLSMRCPALGSSLVKCSSQP